MSTPIESRRRKMLWGAYFAAAEGGQFTRYAQWNTFDNAMLAVQALAGDTTAQQKLEENRSDDARYPNAEHRNVVSRDSADLGDYIVGLVEAGKKCDVAVGSTLQSLYNDLNLSAPSLDE